MARDSTKRKVFLGISSGSGGVIGLMARSFYEKAFSNITIPFFSYSPFLSFPLIFKSGIQKVIPLFNKPIFKDAMSMFIGSMSGLSIGILLVKWTDYMHQEALSENAELKKIAGSYKTTFAELTATKQQCSSLQELNLLLTQENNKLVVANVNLRTEVERLKTSGNLQLGFTRQPRRSIENLVIPTSTTSLTIGSNKI